MPVHAPYKSSVHQSNFDLFCWQGKLQPAAQTAAGACMVTIVVNDNLIIVMLLIN